MDCAEAGRLGAIRLHQLYDSRGLTARARWVLNERFYAQADEQLGEHAPKAQRHALAAALKHQHYADMARRRWQLHRAKRAEQQKVVTA